MKYCTFDFWVSYEDGTLRTETSPFRGENISKDILIHFVESFIAGVVPKPHTIHIDNIIEYIDPQEWLINVKDTTVFKGLRVMNNYAGDLMSEYFPEE